MALGVSDDACHNSLLRRSFGMSSDDASEGRASLVGADNEPDLAEAGFVNASSP